MTDFNEKQLAYITDNGLYERAEYEVSEGRFKYLDVFEQTLDDKIRPLGFMGYEPLGTVFNVGFKTAKKYGIRAEFIVPPRISYYELSELYDRLISTRGISRVDMDYLALRFSSFVSESEVNTSYQEFMKKRMYIISEYQRQKRILEEVGK